MLESLFCMVAVLLILMLLMSLMLFMYQKAMFDIACDEAAEDFAAHYNDNSWGSYDISFLRYLSFVGQIYLNNRKC